MRDFRADHIAAQNRGEAIVVQPVLRLVLDVEVELAGLEGFEGDAVVPVEVHHDPVEIVFAAVHRQFFAPPALHAFEHQAAPGIDLDDAVGAAAQRRGEGGGAEVAILPVMLRQHRKLAQAQDQQRVAGAPQDETHPVGGEDIDPLHLLQVGAVHRVPLLDQGAIGKGHVAGGDRPAVVEACFRPQVEYHPAAVFRVFHALRDQAIAGGWFVAGRVVQAGAHHQRFVQLVDAVLEEIAGADRAGAFQGVGVERVEAARGHQAQGAAFGGVGIGPVEVLEIGRILERAELGITMALGNRGEAGQAHGQAEDQEGEATHQACVRVLGYF